jgi:SAM-dependent methyltransferase
MSAHVIWHEVECGAYAADLPLWEEIADEAGGPILDLGCGTGRVALHLARRGHQVHGLDSDPGLLAALRERAGVLPIEASVGDARDFALAAGFGLALAPMQLLQLFAGPEERLACLRCVARSLRAGGVAAFAIVESIAAGSNVSADGSISPDVVPDAREIDGWVYTSVPLDAGLRDGAIRVRRLRQTVSPSGELAEQVVEVRLQVLEASSLEAEAGAAGLAPAGRRHVAETEAHVGSTVVLLRREA